MNLSRSILLTVAGALLIGCGQKAIFLTKSSRVAPEKRHVQTVLFKPKRKQMQTVVYQPQHHKTETPAIAAVEAPEILPEVAAVEPIVEQPENTEVAVFAPGEGMFGKTKPKFRLFGKKKEADSIRPKLRPNTLVTASAAPAKKPAAATATETPSETVVSLAKPTVKNPGIVVPQTRVSNVSCRGSLTRSIPSRRAGAKSGSKVVKQTMNMGGSERDSYLAREVLAGNLPSFMKKLTPVTFRGKTSRGQNVEVTICVTPDYLAVGSDKDFVRVPLGLPAAAMIADKFNFMLPTTKMVDGIYSQAGVRMRPSPMQAGSRMSSTSYLWEHNETVEAQRVALSRNPEPFDGRAEKDLVLSNRLRSAPGRVAIYGWHRTNGAPIQPLSTVHGARYADYSHGIRLVSATAYVNGKAVPLADLLQDPQLAGFVSKEGTISSPRRLMASLYR